MASSLELGPGSRLLAPSRSRNFSRDSHRRRRTSSSSMMAICAAGPPKAVVPRRRKKSASSSMDPWLAGTADSESVRPVCSGMTCMLSCSKPCIESECPAAHQQQKNQTQQHTDIGAGFVQRAPEPVLGKGYDLG